MREEERQYFFRSKEKKESEQSKTAKFLWKLALPCQHMSQFSIWLYRWLTNGVIRERKK